MADLTPGTAAANAALVAVQAAQLANANVIAADNAGIDLLAAAAPPEGILSGTSALLEAIAITGYLAAAVQTGAYLGRAARNLSL